MRHLLVSQPPFGVRESDRCSMPGWAAGISGRLDRLPLSLPGQGEQDHQARFRIPTPSLGLWSYPPLGALLPLWAQRRQARGSLSTTCWHLGVLAKSPYNEVSEVRRGGEVSEELAEERWWPWGLENCCTAAQSHGVWRGTCPGGGRRGSGVLGHLLGDKERSTGET